MTSSEFDQPEIYGPPKELFELAITLSAADEAIEKCLSIMQNPKADFQKAQQEAFIKIFEVIASTRNYFYVTNENLNTRPLTRLLNEWHDTHQGAKPKFTNVKSKKLDDGGRPKLVEANHARALLVAAVKIKIKEGLKVGEAEKLVSDDTGIKPSTLRSWRSHFNRKDGPPEHIRKLVNSFEKNVNLTHEYENLINQFNLNKIV